MFIDTHAHLIWKELAGKESETVENAKKAGVEKIITIGCDLETCEGSMRCAEKFDNVFFTAGIHPSDAKDSNIDWGKYESFLSHEKCKAVGECGFDFYYDKYDEKLQEKFFEKQIELSKKHNLPIIIHTRDAGKKTLEFIKHHKLNNFVVHCFTETMEFAKKVLDSNGMLSFTGIITYKKADSVREVVKYAPLERIMLETDCPYLAPQSVRGQVNEPKYIPEIADKIAEIKEMNFKDIEEITTKNAEKFFNI